MQSRDTPAQLRSRSLSARLTMRRGATVGREADCRAVAAAAVLELSRLCDRLHAGVRCGRAFDDLSKRAILCIT